MSYRTDREDFTNYRTINDDTHHPSLHLTSGDRNLGDKVNRRQDGQRKGGHGLRRNHWMGR